MAEERVEHEVAQLRAEVAALRAKVEAPRRRRWLPLMLAVGLFSTLASAQLVTFTADQPAIADQVNANFNQLKTWLEQKVGTVGSSTITTNSIVVGSGTTATLGSNSSGQLTLSGGLALAEGAGLNTNRLAAVTSVVNSTTNTFSGGFLEGTFADPGGTVVIMASATGWCGSPGGIRMSVKVDGMTMGSMRVTCNVANSHMAFPATFLRLNRGILPSPGFGPAVSRTVRLEPVNCASGCNPGLVTTNADANDFGEVTVLRLPTP